MSNSTPLNESRVRKTLLNARVNLIFYFITLFLSFFSRKIFLDCLGVNFVGLTGTLENLLGFLNLAELGIGSAIGYVLYKPLFDKDRGKITEIISVMGYLYRWIGIIILVSGIILSFFIPLIFPSESTGFDYKLIYFAYYTFLSSSLIGYFINYRQNLLGADQKNYIVAAYYQTINIIKILIQIALAYYTRNLYLWILIQFVFGIIYCFILNWKINQTYPWLKTKIKEGKRLLKVHSIILTKTKQLFIQKISYFAQYQTVPFLTYAFVNLGVVALYGNYTIITTKLSQFANTFLESSGASIGNLVAEGNKTKIIKLFWELLNMRYFMAGCFAFAILNLINPFITVWLGPQYLLPDIIIYLLVTDVFIQYIRGGVMQFMYGYGLFADIWAPISEIVINLSVAVIGGMKWGLPGILMGGIVSQFLIVGIWKPIYLYWKGFELPIYRYWVGLFKLLACVFVPFFILLWFVVPWIGINPYEGYLSWILYAIVLFSMYALFSFATLFVFNKGMRDFTARFIKIKNPFNQTN